MQKIVLVIFCTAAVLVMNSCGKTCTEGFRGKNCDIEITPSKVSITKVTVKSFSPLAPNLSNWDLGSSADVYPVITGENISNVVWTATTYYNDAVSGNSYEFIPTSEVELIYPTMLYTVGIYDFDGGTVFNEDDLVGSVQFKPYQQGLAFPKVISFTSGLTSVDLEVKYYW
jgi:hypothetical protein